MWNHHTFCVFTTRWLNHCQSSILKGFYCKLLPISNVGKEHRCMWKANKWKYTAALHEWANIVVSGTMILLWGTMILLSGAGTPGRWGNPPNRDRKLKRVYVQSYNPGVLGWGFLRLLLRLQLRSLSRGVPSSHLEKDERLILGHICIYSWKRHALCYAVFGFARNRWLNTLYGIVWETKYGWFITLNIPKCKHFTLLVCSLRFGDFSHETARKCTEF